MGKFEAVCDIPGVAMAGSKVDLIQVLLDFARDKSMHAALMHLVHGLASDIEDA